MKFHNLKDGNWVQLSRILDSNTPAYGNGERIVVEVVNQNLDEMSYYNGVPAKKTNTL